MYVIMITIDLIVYFTLCVRVCVCDRQNDHQRQMRVQWRGWTFWRQMSVEPADFHKVIIQLTSLTSNQTNWYVCLEYLLVWHYAKQLIYILVYWPPKSHEVTTEVTVIFPTRNLRLANVILLVSRGSRIRISYLTPESLPGLVIQVF